ncbi:unnamed protein product [Allacma fusca]|uniref:Uncharacterized protein n=1 Tax=Allacma fusca TaxID=39272 RepID=A0A8J2KCH2_9HEXA|nr:unnamed protein product [Allacma fusca]
MSFFGLFNWGSESENGNKLLREHLKKCAGLGDRPPVYKCCDTSDPCADRTGCSKRPGDQDDQDACPEPERCNLVPYCPKCDVPATLTFSCPEGTCPPISKPKTKCCPRPEQAKSVLCPRPKESEDEKKKRCQKPKPTGCGSENSCEPRPLRYG